MKEINRDRHELFRMAFNTSKDAMIAINREGLITLFNPAAEKMFFRKKEEMLGTAPEVLMPDYYRNLHNNYVKSYFSTGKPDGAIDKTVELPAFRSDGKVFPVELTLSAAKEEGRTFVLAVIRDVTMRKRREEDLISTNKELELAIQKAQNLAMEAQVACMAKSKFLAHISHEIRTPMNGVIGLSRLLLNTELSKRQYGYIKTVYKSAQSLLSIINDILDFSSIEATRMTLDIRAFNLMDIIEEVIDMMAVGAGEKRIDFNCLIHNKVPLLLTGDPGRIRQILINLIGNAIKFTEEGEVFVQVISEKETDNDVKLHFSIADTGIGLSEEQEGSVFEAFVRFDYRKVKKTEGTGLGLAISKGLVELMGGKIGAEPNADRKGSLFWFTLLLKKQDEEENRLFNLPQEIKKHPVLLVINSKTVRAVIKEYLKRLGFLYIEEAENGAEAMKILLERDSMAPVFKLAFIDIGIPDVGKDFGLYIKEKSGLADLVLILLLSNSRIDHRDKINAAGFSSYISSPLKFSGLYNCLLKIIGPEKVFEEDFSISSEFYPKEKSNTNIHILIVDDSPVNQKVALEFLESRGYSAHTVNNGKEAIKALKEFNYDIILMDIQMPEMDGFETTFFIRNGNSPLINKNIPIIAMTAFAMEEDRLRCIERGMDDYIIKPVQPEKLFQAIEKQLEGKLKIKEMSSKNYYNIDMDKLLKRFNNKEEFCEELLRSSLKLFPSQVKELENAVENNEVQQIILLSHRLKGDFANIEVHSLKKLSSNIEIAAKKGNMDIIPSFLEDIKKELNKLKSFLNI